MRPRLRVLLPGGLAAALALAGVAFGADGGFGPPEARSPNAGRIEDAYWLIFGVTAGIFVIVETALIFFVVRFRSRGRSREVEGPQIRGHTRLELAWTVVPVLLLAGIAGFVFYKLPGIKDVPAATAGGSGAINVKVSGHQFYWRYEYPGGELAYDTLVVPVNRVVTVDIVGADVAHSWWPPNLAGKQDAIPGQTTNTWFRADRVGTYPLRCAEFCGIEHAHMVGTVKVVTEGEYRGFLAAHRQTSNTVGDELVVAVCAKCHGLSGEGDIGPPLANNPIVDDRNALVDVLRNGREPARSEYGMPAVGATWTDQELETAIRALKRAYGREGGGGGG